MMIHQDGATAKGLQTTTIVFKPDCVDSPIRVVVEATTDVSIAVLIIGTANDIISGFIKS